MTTAIDHIALNELRLYADNTGDLYRERTRPILINLGKRFKKNTYDVLKARKLWEHWADDAAKRYAKEFASPRDWFTIFPKALREEMAANKERHEREEMEHGNFVTD